MSSHARTLSGIRLLNVEVIKVERTIIEPFLAAIAALTYTDMLIQLLTPLSRVRSVCCVFSEREFNQHYVLTTFQKYAASRRSSQLDYVGRVIGKRKQDFICDGVDGHEGRK